MGETKTNEKMKDAAPPSADVAWPTSAKEYEKVSLIGKGATAEVWRAKVPSIGKECALKIVKAAYLESRADAWKLMTKEIKILKELNHKNIVSFYTSFIDEEDLWMVMELVD